MKRQLADTITILISSMIANFLFNQSYDGTTILLSILSLFLFLTLVFLSTLYFFGIYSYRRNLAPRARIIKLFKASVFSAITICIIFSFFNYYFAQNFTFSDLIFSEISLAWSLTIIGMISSRIFVYSYVSDQRENKRELNLNPKRRKALVIGGAGYIGSSLAKKLLNKGYRVRILDIFLFGREPLAEVINHDRLELFEGDFRKIDDLVHAINGCDTVIHLGGIVGDPACSVDEGLTKEINLTATKIIGQISKSAGVGKFIFASSCSVYGAQESILTEESETKPLSLYAKTKIASEKILNEISDENFSPIFLRFGTVFGFSGRTRFDLVVNLLTANAFFKKSMTVFGKDQIRPFVHVEDAAKSIVCALEADLNDCSEDLVFNVGSNDLNVTLHDLALLIKENIPESEIILEEGGDDARNYHVSFDKAQKYMNFKSDWTLNGGIIQVLEKLRNGEIVDYNSANHSNLKHLREEGLSVLTEKESNDWEEMLLEESYS